MRSVEYCTVRSAVQSPRTLRNCSVDSLAAAARGPRVKVVIFSGEKCDSVTGPGGVSQVRGQAVGPLLHCVEGQERRYDAIKVLLVMYFIPKTSNINKLQ